MGDKKWKHHWNFKKQRVNLPKVRKEMKRGKRKNVNAIGWWSWIMRDDVFLFSMCMNNNGFEFIDEN
jgi:hypothetical protein